jgi:SAM-dependent methyltransferase
MILSASRDVYAQKALVQIPRLLSLQDRNPFSPTYGCFHRDYWLYKTSDFPDAVRQFGVQVLALVYRHDFPNNIYKGQQKIRDWAIAGLDYWASIQHKDGSFDEFYPYERGWVGPSAFTTYTVTEAYRLLQDEIPADVAGRVLGAIRKAAQFISAGESEEDHLANHHAMACLAVWKAHELLQDHDLRKGFDRLWEGFVHYHNTDEGWSREYDGVDPGYLSATVSFLAKVYQTNPDPQILAVLRQSVEFCSYFVYPNGFYGGSIGSRNTLHFYPHGFEILAGEILLAAAVAERMLQGLAEGKLVPPEIMSDRYVFYRVPEFLLAYLAHKPRPTELPQLPYERDQFTRYFPEARVFVANQPQWYVVANLAKGGVTKVFDRQSSRLVMNDCGVIGRLVDGRVVTSQWVDPDYEVEVEERGWEVSGSLHVVPSNKLFTPFRHILFRGALVALGWIPRFSHVLKGCIRRTLTLGRRPIPIRFSRRLESNGDDIALIDTLSVDGGELATLSVGDEFFVRYVPQSRYFQRQELDVQGHMLGESQVQFLNEGRPVNIRRSVLAMRHEATESCTKVFVSVLPSASKEEDKPRSSAVYGVDYFAGRQNKRQLVYRLRRRTDEVEAALRQYGGERLRTIVDVGTADGLMLDDLRRRIGPLTYFGVDLSLPLLGANPGDGVLKAQADALRIPVKNDVADAVIATAVIEHVTDPSAMLTECARVLRRSGLLILTTPVPFMDHLANLIGVWKDTGHVQTFTLDQIKALLESHGFSVLEARKFMFSPVGFPAEESIERVFGPLGLSLLMANQLLVGRWMPDQMGHTADA